MSELIEDIIEILIKKGPLKARKIALALDPTRTRITHTQVNSELYNAKGLEGLSMDSANVWCYVSNNVKKISFDSFSSWLNSTAIERVLRNHPNLLNSVSEIEFDFSNKSLFLDCILKILSLTNQLILTGSKVTLKFDEKSNGFSYLQRCGFFDNIHEKVKILPFRPQVSLAKIYHVNSDNLFEIFAIKKECDESLLSRISKIIEDKMSEEDAEKLLNKILTLIGELVDNIHQHGSSKIDGYIALQVYNSKEIIISISDSGSGLINTLRKEALRHYPDIPELKKLSIQNTENDIQLIGYIFNKGQISRTGLDGRGLGLSKSNKVLQKISINNGKEISLIIRQNSNEFIFPFDINGISINECNVKSNLTYINGTHYVITIKT